jgi:hypothetical protein
LERDFCVGQISFHFYFSVPTAEQHGYKDKWEDDDVYSYTGAGQVGDMQFEGNNLALLYHKEKGKRVFLFIGVRKAYVRFEAELEVIDFDFFPGLDREGHQRTAIKFFLKKVGKSLSYDVEHSALSLVSEPTSLRDRDAPTITERQGLVTSRVGQGAYRKSILFRWKYRCAVTNYSKREILIASHIVPWKDSTNEERLDVDNGILLSPTYDALFDQHLIGFENNGKIVLSEMLLKTNFKLIGITGRETIKRLSTGNISYLERHRDNLLPIPV